MGINKIKAIFLDRDGVINKPVFHSETNCYCAPMKAEDLKLYPWTIETLKKAYENNYDLFLFSNQADYEKGNCKFIDLLETHKYLDSILNDNGIIFTDYFYCYHKLESNCHCRKPSPYFVNESIKRYDLDREKCYFIGDRDTDILCGKNAKIKTILVKSEETEFRKRECFPDYRAENLKEAIELIIKEENNA